MDGLNLNELSLAAIEPVEEGFVARCDMNPMATSFGKTVEEAGDNLVAAILEYLRMYPNKVDLVATPKREVELPAAQ